MEYTQFIEEIRQCVEIKVKNRAQVRVDRVFKNNREPVDTLCILNAGENISPAIYLDPYYSRYKNGDTLEEIADSILNFNRIHKVCGNMDMDFYSDYSKVRDRILSKLINFEKNRETLARIPYHRFWDLAVVYYYKMDNTILGPGTILVQNKHLELWGVTEEQLRKEVFENTVRILPFQLISVEDMIRDTLGLREDVFPEKEKVMPMYVLTNNEQNLGAVTIIFKQILRAVGEIIRSDYYILPSSIHECMIIPDFDWIDKEVLQNMVREINEEHVAEEEILGESVYHYSLRDNQMTLACSGDRYT